MLRSRHHQQAADALQVDAAVGDVQLPDGLVDVVRELLELHDAVDEREAHVVRARLHEASDKLNPPVVERNEVQP